MAYDNSTAQFWQMVHTVIVAQESIDGSGVLWDNHPVNFVVMVHSSLISCISTCAYDHCIPAKLIITAVCPCWLTICILPMLRTDREVKERWRSSAQDSATNWRRSSGRKQGRSYLQQPEPPPPAGTHSAGACIRSAFLQIQRRATP